MRGRPRTLSSFIMLLRFADAIINIDVRDVIVKLLRGINLQRKSIILSNIVINKTAVHRWVSEDIIVYTETIGIRYVL